MNLSFTSLQTWLYMAMDSSVTHVKQAYYEASSQASKFPYVDALLFTPLIDDASINPPFTPFLLTSSASVPSFCHVDL